MYRITHTQPTTKTIGFLDSFCLHLNNLTGPALVLLPLINQEAGWLPCTIGLFLLAFFSFLASTMLAEAIQRIPGLVHAYFHLECVHIPLHATQLSHDTQATPRSAANTNLSSWCATISGCASAGLSSSRTAPPHVNLSEQIR